MTSFSTAAKRGQIVNHWRLIEGRGSYSAVFDSVSPAYYTLRFFGFAPYAFRKNRPSRLQPSTANCLYSIFWMFAYVYLVYGILARWGDNPDTPISNITEKLKPILNCTATVVELLSSMINRKRFVDFWNSIVCFDESYGLGIAINPLEVAAGKPPKYGLLMRRANVYLWVWIFFGVFGWTCVNQFGMIGFDEHYLQNMSYMIVYVGNFAAVSKFCGLVLLLGQRFALLNKMVRQQTKVTAKQNTKGMIKKIETSFHQLMDMSISLNEMYSVGLFLVVSNLLYHSVSNLYFMSCFILFNRDAWTVRIFLIQFSWMMMFLVQLCGLHLCCEYTSQKANKMAHHMLDWQRSPNGFDVNAFEPTLHFMTNQLHFSASGFFGASVTSLGSNIKFVSIYLMILLQISQT